ncbi:hypothetical protein FHL15_011059 [Xylaria flabelliformis]|uniref:C2H2-type domain-containing protein n=1 Tax=Xylaria flabelliformis TaxID=2512241 RepID=A0A553HJC9_9PEZI|nr:hypothetical protein FHL15_011059 [Xylaria flabelliformis]
MDDHHLSLTSPGPSDATGKDPLYRWYGEGGNDAPWHPPLTTGPEDGSGQSMMSNIPTSQFIVPGRSNVVPSEIMPQSDSGYGSYRNQTSIANGSVCEDSYDANPDTQSIMGASMVDAQFPISEVIPNSWEPTIRIETHDQRHKKPFKCDVNDCARRIEGFSTTNDLDRHKRSVHPETQTLGNRYMCQIGTCKSKAKVWPRADNFKAHLKRVHAKDSISEEELEACIVQQSTQPIQSTSLDELQNSPQQEAMPSYHGFSSLSSGQSNWSSFHQIPQSINALGPLNEVQDEESLSLTNSRRELADLHLHPAASQQRLYPEITEPCSTSHSSIDLSSPIQHGQLTLGPGTPVSVSSPVQEQMTPTARDHSIDTQATGTDASRLVLLNESDESLSSSSPMHSLIGNLVKRDGEVSDFVKPDSLPAHGAGSTSFDLSSLNLDDSSDVKRLFDVLQSRGLLEQHGYKKEEPDAVEPVKIENDAVISHTQCHRCPTCNKTFPRRCELKKHEKRHEKPYGCTMPDCEKRFGSKNDWKRHENTQHFMLEMWRCDVEGCEKVCYRRELFRTHLEKDHPITDPNILEAKLESCRVGRNCEARFWCGFCQEIVEIKQKGIQAWAERFDHIDEHFSGRNRAQREISEWKNFDPSRRSKDASIEDSDDGDQSFSSRRNVKTQSIRQGAQHSAGSTRSKRKRTDGNGAGSSKKARGLESRGVYAVT